MQQFHKDINEKGKNHFAKKFLEEKYLGETSLSLSYIQRIRKTRRNINISAFMKFMKHENLESQFQTVKLLYLFFDVVNQKHVHWNTLIWKCVHYSYNFFLRYSIFSIHLMNNVNYIFTVRLPVSTVIVLH